MPGHSVSETVASEVEDIILKLENLIEEHDVIFLLMDSRESRWLPTLIASSKKKVIYYFTLYCKFNMYSLIYYTHTYIQLV